MNKALVKLFLSAVPEELKEYVERIQKLHKGVKENKHKIKGIKGDIVNVCQTHQEKENFAVISSCILANLSQEQITEELQNLENHVNEAGSDNQKLLVVAINYILKGN